MTPCSILLVDDHPIVMQGIKSLLAPVEDFVICGMAKSGAEAVTLAASLSPQIVVLDLMMPEMNGVETARCILQIRPQSRILIYTADETQSHLPELIHIGIMGHVRKSETPGVLVKALESLRQGDIYLSFPDPGCRVAAMLRDRLEKFRNASELEVLSPREKELFRMLAECIPIKDIAARLSISQKTVETHKYSIFSKLQLGSSAELVKKAIRHGIIRP